MSENVSPTQQVTAASAGLHELLPQATQGVILQRQGSESFLMDTNTGEVFAVNESAARIFQACQDHTTFSGLVETLKKSTGAVGQDQQILEDVQRTVKQLQGLGLCESPVTR